MEKLKRTHYLGSIREGDVGSIQTVCGWVQTKRDMGGVIFLDMRDREGTLQVVINSSEVTREEFAAAEELRLQSVVAVRGLIRIRDAETYNTKLDTGTIELAARTLQVISQASPLPFSADDSGVREDVRLKYRYIDLRRAEMQSNLRFRAKVSRIIREYLDSDGFIEIETPMLAKSTPEGAREYLVPSRVHKGRFYALPQSPQIFKQL
ncbi:MAG: amino acid--tRNA ligase-related protein, partial [Eubacteriales bacterium]